MLRRYFQSLYQRTMREAYEQATREIVSALRSGGEVLDCGANSGWMYGVITEHMPLARSDYVGLDWDDASVAEARKQELNVIKADLNAGLPFGDDRFSCVYAVSVLEHPINGCRFMRECHRVLKPGGTLVLLTPPPPHGFLGHAFAVFLREAKESPRWRRSRQ